MNQVRQALLTALARLSERYPSMRLGQLVCMVASLAGVHAEALPDDVADAALIDATQDQIRNAIARGRSASGLTGVRKHVFAVLATNGSAWPELGKWLTALAGQAHSNIYDIEDEQLLQVLTKQQAAPVPVSGTGGLPNLP